MNLTSQIAPGRLSAIAPNLSSIRSDQQKGRFNDPDQFQVRSDPMIVAQPVSGRTAGFCGEEHIACQFVVSVLALRVGRS